jgi:hypothetical protein
VRAILWLLCAIALVGCGAGQRGPFAYDDSAQLDVRVSSSHLDGGVRISEHANCGWGITGTEERLFVDTATNVYGHGVLTTHVRERGQCLEVAREFRPFAAPS